MNMRFRLGGEGNLNLLFFDDVSGTGGKQHSRQGSPPRSTQSTGEKISCKRARHGLKIVAGNGRSAKAQVPKAMENQRLREFSGDAPARVHEQKRCHCGQKAFSRAAASASAWASVIPFSMRATFHAPKARYFSKRPISALDMVGKPFMRRCKSSCTVGIRQANQAEHDRISAERRIKLVVLGDGENLTVGEAGAIHAFCRGSAGKRMLVRSCAAETSCMHTSSLTPEFLRATN